MVDVINNPSLDFTAIPPRLAYSDEPDPVKKPLDLVVMLRQYSHDRLHISALRPRAADTEERDTERLSHCFDQ